MPCAVSTRLVRRQGTRVAGYASRTERVAPEHDRDVCCAQSFIENWRWTGVPFYLRTGKRMAGRRTEIAIHYKPAPYQMFRDTPVEELTPNIVRLLIDPEQGTETQFMAKIPGPEMRLGPVDMSMRYKRLLSGARKRGLRDLALRLHDG